MSTTLRERALSAATANDQSIKEQEDQVRLRQQADRSNGLLTQLSKAIGSEVRPDVTFTERSARCVIDGLTFEWRSYNDGLELVTPCPKGHEISERFYDLNSLGYAIRNGEERAYYCPYCRHEADETRPAPVAPATLEQRLMGLLREFVCDVIQEDRP